MNTPPIVSPEEWEAARQQLLVKEKQLTRARDALAPQRRRMPWLAVEKEYAFDGPEGKASLLDLFDGRRQLVVYRAFFEPGVSGWPEHACIGCSMLADQVAHGTNAFIRDGDRVFRSRLTRPGEAGGRAPVDGRAVEVAVAFDRLTRVHREPDRPLRTDRKGGDAT